MATTVDGPIPVCLRGLSQSDVDGQRNIWRASPTWMRFLSSRPELAGAFTSEVAEHGGTRRSFVHSYADGDPIDLFYAAMAWGYGTTNVRFPIQRSMLEDPPVDKISRVIDLTRTFGAEVGWYTLHNQNKISGLGYAFGTKLLYFAGYHLDLRPRPLILDLNVLLALHDAGTGILANGGVWRADYMAYLELAETWSRNPLWDQPSEVVEFGLFRRGQDLYTAVRERRRRFGAYGGPE